MDTLTRMRAFVGVVEEGGFSAAARKIGRSKALLSKYVRELEDELGALLLNRTTRQLSLTEAGQIYHKQAAAILAEIDRLNETMSDAAGETRGSLKLSAPRAFADSVYGQALVDFAVAFPDIKLDVHLEDRFVDVVEEGFDIALRVARLDDSSLIAKKLADFTVRICASPATIARWGEPSHPEQLSDLPCICDTNGRWRDNWPFQHPENGASFSVPVSPRIKVNSPLVTRSAILTDLGFAVVPEFTVFDDIAEKRLVSVLDSWLPKGAGLYAVYPHRRHLPAKVRSFVDFQSDWFRSRPLNSNPNGADHG